MSDRTKWLDQSYRPFNSVPVKAKPRHNVKMDHNYHLMMLQERNRLLKKINQRQEETELKKKEKGFSLYLNGANTAAPPPCRLQTALRKPAPDPMKLLNTTGDVCVESSDGRGERSKTAPARKEWSHDTVIVKTEDGESVPVTAPEIISGCYDDDFESSAAEMTEDDYIPESSSSEYYQSVEEEEEEEEKEEEQKSLEGTLSSEYQDSLLESSITDDIVGDNEVEDTNDSDCLKPSTAGPETHNNDTALSALTERVKELNLSGQRKLLQMLLNPNSQATPTSSETTPTPVWFKRPIESQAPLPPPLSRPVSTRSTGLRGEMMADHSTNDQRGMTEVRPFLSARTRTSELAGGRTSSSGRTSSRASGRTSGIRGQLLSRTNSLHSMEIAKHETEESEKMEHSSSQPDLHYRPDTTVLSSCHRSSHTPSSPQVVLTNTSSNSTHLPHPPSDDLNDSLASIAFFDHIHEGQLGRTTPDEEILRSILTQHHHKRELGSEMEEEEEEWSMVEEKEGYSTPILPTGHQLVLNLLTTWGDQFYIGLTGIEIFTESGNRAGIAQIVADPPDINVLPEYTGDPRVITNLLDGINKTKDDLHMWLAPFTPSHPHTITISFSSITTLAMIRIWNYNKSRIHSYRGVRDMEIWLDQQLIFRGEITRGSGGILNSSCGETILFTTDKDILYRVGLHDNCFLESQSCCDGDREIGDGGRKEEEERDLISRDNNISFVQSTISSSGL